MRKIMAALDIGNSLIKLVVGEMTNNDLNILSVSQTTTKGIERNEITSEEDLKDSILKVLNDSQTKLNIPIKKLITIVPSFDIEFSIGEAKINIDNENNVITGNDINKVLHESYNGIIPPNMELINNIPMHFKLDNDQIVSDPKKIVSSTLAVKSVILMAPKKNIIKILSIINSLGVEIIDISVDAIGDYYAFKNKETASSIGAIINIGGNNTTVSIFNKGVMTNIANIELGGRNIDNDISYIYKIDSLKSKYLKEEFAYAIPKYASKDDEIVERDRNGHDVKIDQEEISKIVYSRLKEILSKAKLEINNLTKKEISYIIITGGISELTDFKFLVEEMFDKTQVFMDINYLGARNNKFSSVIGLIKWYNDIEKLLERDYSIFSIDEQEEFSGLNKQELETNNSVLGKFFSYFLDN